MGVLCCARWHVMAVMGLVCADASAHGPNAGRHMLVLCGEGLTIRAWCAWTESSSMWKLIQTVATCDLMCGCLHEHALCAADLNGTWPGSI